MLKPTTMQDDSACYQLDFEDTTRNDEGFSVTLTAEALAKWGLVATDLIDPLSKLAFAIYDKHEERHFTHDYQPVYSFNTYNTGQTLEETLAQIN